MSDFPPDTPDPEPVPDDDDGTPATYEAGTSA
jgi:hypothetical protein